MNELDEDGVCDVVHELEAQCVPNPPAGSSEPGEPYSPTLASIEAERRPSPQTVCEGCPKSMWFASAKHLQCYCRVMHAIVYSSEDKSQPLIACDGLLLLDEE